MGENFARNLQLVERIQEIAAEQNCTPGQLALAWVLSQSRPPHNVVPIPGTKRRRFLEENVEATELELSEEDLARIDEVAPVGAAAGDRYADMSSIGR
jgi:aryl-alcohol dehydrogenase-like predicted oxidoreductase